MQLEETTEVTAIDAGAVMQFLTCNPDFFDANPDFVARLRVPHATGNAVSLVEKQVSVLRSKCNQLESSLHDLIGVARDNEELHNRLHGLIQDVISANDLESVLEMTGKSLIDNFNATDVRLLVFDNTAKRRKATRLDADNAHLATAGHKAVDRKTMQLFDGVFEHGATLCGMPEITKLEVLAGEGSSEIGSAALIPLSHEGRLGVLMLASRDESRFSSGKGVMFLDQLGEVLSRRLHALGIKPQ
jgi:uncharacterized protein YigA (DUF484 family)